MGGDLREGEKELEEKNELRGRERLVMVVTERSFVCCFFSMVFVGVVGFLVVLGVVSGC